jgi:hypothetical protein
VEPSLHRGADEPHARRTAAASVTECDERGEVERVDEAEASQLERGELGRADGIVRELAARWGTAAAGWTYSKRSPARPRSWAMRVSTSWPPTSSVVRFSELYAASAPPVNNAPFVFLDPRAEVFYGDWERVTGECVAILRWAVGRDPHDRDLSDLVGELATRSEVFRTRWAAHDVRFHNTGVKHFHHPVVGELSLSFDRLDLAADHGLAIFTYAAEPGSPSEEALRLLGSWAATVDSSESARDRPKLSASATQSASRAGALSTSGRIVGT